MVSRIFSVTLRMLLSDVSSPFLLLSFPRPILREATGSFSLFFGIFSSRPFNKIPASCAAGESFLAFFFLFTFLFSIFVLCRIPAPVPESYRSEIPSFGFIPASFPEKIFSIRRFTFSLKGFRPKGIPTPPSKLRAQQIFHVRHRTYFLSILSYFRVICNGFQNVGTEINFP